MVIDLAGWAQAICLVASRSGSMRDQPTVISGTWLTGRAGVRICLGRGIYKTCTVWL